MHIDRERVVDKSVARHVDMYSNMYNTQHNATLRTAETFGPQHPLYPELSNQVRDLTINQTPLNFQEMESNVCARMQPLQQLDQFSQVLPPAPSRQPPPSIVPPPTLSLGPYASLSMASSSYSPSRTEAGLSNFPGNYGAEPEDSQMEERATGPAVNTEGVIGNDPGDDMDEGSLYDG
ncbi:hypothetical protein FRC06_002313 [Ceratobasidium sp. 370]|nr:hypothetical protein FRC06_002313 [Ceratobasidium sp. 370]